MSGILLVPTRLRHGHAVSDWITYTGQFSCGEGSETQQSAVEWGVGDERGFERFGLRCWLW